MSPTPGASRPVISWSAEAALHGITNADWLGVVTGVVVGVGTMAVAILIAWHRRVIEIRDRNADQAARQVEQERVDRAERDRRERVAHREVWRAEYEEDRELLKLGEDIAYQVRNHGPFTTAGLSSLRLDEFVMEAEQLADRGVEPLRGPLLKVAALSQQLRQAAVPPAGEVMAAYAAASNHAAIPDGLHPHALQRLAITQDRVARELADEITSTWQTLRIEWAS